MKRCLFGLFLVVTSVFTAHGQKVSNVDFDAIKAEVADASSRFYFPKLLERHQAADSTLTIAELVHLYYGQEFAENYSPYGSAKSEFLKVYNKQQYKEAIPLGEAVLADYPLNMKVLFKVLVCYDVLGDKATATTYARRYFSLSNAIQSSGDGKSFETAFVVMAVPDEYMLLRDLKLSAAGSQALVKETDVLKVKPEDATDNSTFNVYFNVSRPLASLRRGFIKK